MREKNKTYNSNSFVYSQILAVDMHFYIAASEKGLVMVEINMSESEFLHQLKHVFKPKSITYEMADDNQYAIELTEYLEGIRKQFSIPLDIRGTDFQKKVWSALLEIPYGETASYSDIAKKIGNPKACRAVGMANNKNRIPIVIPCHRIIGINKKLIGYGGGLFIKEKLLSLEGIEVIDGKVV